MNGPLSIIMLAEQPSPIPQTLLRQLYYETQAGDRLAFICEQDTATEIRLFEEMEGFASGVDVRIVDLAVPGRVTFETRLELGYAAVWDALGSVLILDAGSQLDVGMLASLRAATSGPDAPDIIELMAADDDPYLLPRLLIAPALLRDPARPKADGPDGTVALARYLVETASKVDRIAVAENLPPRLAEPEPTAAQAFARLAKQGEGTRKAVTALLPALWRRATPGARAMMSPILLDADLVPPVTLAAPARTGKAPLRVWRGGPHAHRMPLAYPALRPLWEGRISLVEDPGTADLLAISHPLDALTLAPDVARAAERGVPAVLLSEEPFWDSLFSPDPLAAQITLPAAHLGELRLHQLNHHRSAIFDFERIPYYLLTDHRFASIYATRFARNARLEPEDWASAWATRPRDIVFMAERRMEAFHDMAVPEAGLVGLCAWRSRLASACEGDRVERLGASWSGGRTRFELPDWHLDKLMRLDGRTRLLSALENTHQPLYLSEKLFDAFACGAMPIYLAAPGHAVERLGLPETSWINLWGLDESSAQERIAPACEEVVDWKAYATAQAQLAALFEKTKIAVCERQRLANVMVFELSCLVD